MDSDTNTQEPGEATVAFERALERLVLESYAKGVQVEGTWTVTVPVADAPDWTVVVEKCHSGESSSYEPTVLEE